MVTAAVRHCVMRGFKTAVISGKDVVPEQYKRHKAGKAVLAEAQKRLRLLFGFDLVEKTKRKPKASLLKSISTHLSIFANKETQKGFIN
jgi:hypothetical protein